MEKKAKIIDSADNVVTSLADIKAGEHVAVKFGNEKRVYAAQQDVPFGHKIAVCNIKKGQNIVKYGQVIGIASTEIKTGDWVHTHNVKDNYEVK
jgi:Altronate dehydratase